MTNPENTGRPEQSNQLGQQWAHPREVQIAVVSAAVVFATHREEFIGEGWETETPTFCLENIPYDPKVTPHLTPYDTCSIYLNFDPRSDELSMLDVYFKIPTDSEQGPREVVRTLTLFGDGSVTDFMDDPAASREERRLDPETPTGPASNSPKDVRAYIGYVLAKIDMREMVEMIEGVPKAPEAISRGELDDIIRLLPTMR